MLFEEKNLKFSLENSSDNFYGLKIEGDIESLATIYDIETLENSKASLQNQLNNLVAGHNIRYKNLEESIKTATNKVVSKLIFSLRDNVSTTTFLECMEALKNIN